MNGKMEHQKIIYQLTDKRIPAASEIGIVGDILEKASFSEQFRDVKLAEKRSRKQIDAGAVMTTFIALLCMGKDNYFFQSAAATLGLTVFSHSRDSSASLECHGFRNKVIVYDTISKVDDHLYSASKFMGCLSQQIQPKCFSGIC